MKTVQIDQYICLDVDQIVADEMKMILSCKLRKTDFQEDRDSMAKTKRAARVILSHYTIRGQRCQ
jgi:hypothetical protein